MRKCCSDISAFRLQCEYTLRKVQQLLTNNYYPEYFYEPLIKQTRECTIRANGKANWDPEDEVSLKLKNALLPNL